MQTKGKVWNHILSDVAVYCSLNTRQKKWWINKNGAKALNCCVLLVIIRQAFLIKPQLYLSYIMATVSVNNRLQ